MEPSIVQSLRAISECVLVTMAESPGAERQLYRNSVKAYLFVFEIEMNGLSIQCVTMPFMPLELVWSSSVERHDRMVLEENLGSHLNEE